MLLKTVSCANEGADAESSLLDEVIYVIIIFKLSM